MARGVNKVIVIGNVGNDPEVRYTPNGNAVTNVSLATSEVWKDKQSGEQQERTEWHRIVFFNRLGEIAGEFLKKGSKVYVEGSLRTRKWLDKTGTDKYTTEIIANEMQMLDSKMSNTNNNAGFSPAKVSSTTTSKAPASGTPAPVASAASTTHEEFDDDIPF